MLGVWKYANGPRLFKTCFNYASNILQKLLYLSQLPDPDAKIVSISQCFNSCDYPFKA
jgi:hypothetical protein